MADLLAAYHSLLADPFARGAAGVVIGAIIGSFLATILIRWPKGEGAVAGRSRCDACGEKLGARDLVPILSYVLARGRCRRCGARIDARHVAVELAAAGVGLVGFLTYPVPLAFATALLGWWLLLLALLDLEHQWLPDRLTLPLIATGLAIGWTELGPPFIDRLVGAAIGWSALMLIGAGYRLLRGREGLGGGDPKLLAAIGAWVGAWHLPFILLGAGVIGLMSVGLMRLRKQEVTGMTRLSLGTFLALAAWPVWLVVAS